jgi:hypothetical protein
LNQSRLAQLVESITSDNRNGTGLKISDITIQPNEALLSSIDATLTDLLSAKVREALYDYLAREKFLAREDIPSHLNQFIALLQKTFGSGSATIQRRITKSLYQTLNWEEIEVTDFGLTEHFALVEAIADRIRFLTKNSSPGEAVEKSEPSSANAKGQSR